MTRITATIVIATMLAATHVAVLAHGQNDDTTIGRHGELKNASRTIEITMLDTMRFEPAIVSVKKGETIHFVVRNAGKMRHEMMLGSSKALQEHADMMRAMPNMVHRDANAVAINPGQSGDLLWQFTQIGTVEFACLEPGHFEAGMRGAIIVK